jgi:hypothetical protein
MSLHINFIFKSICGSTLNCSCLSGLRFKKKNVLHHWIKPVVQNLRHKMCRHSSRSQFRSVQHTNNTSPTLLIKTHHTAALVITLQALKNFKSHDFNNYPFLAHIYIT